MRNLTVIFAKLCVFILQFAASIFEIFCISVYLYI